MSGDRPNIVHVTRDDLPERQDASSQVHAALLAWMNQLAPEGIFTTDTELRITSWNEWMSRHTGLKPEQVIGKPLVKVIPTLVERRLDHAYRDALLGESKVLSRSLHGYLLPLAPASLGPPFLHMQQSARIAPMLLQGRVIGTITVIEDVTEREWHYWVLRRARRRGELLARTLANLLAARNPEHLLRRIFAHISVPLGLDCYLHHVPNPETGQVHLVSAAGLTEEEERGTALLELGRLLNCSVLEARQQIVVNHLQERPEPRLAPCRALGFKAFAGFPLVISDRLLGSLTFGTRTRVGFPDEDVQFLLSIARYASIALDRAQQEARVRASEEQLARAQAELAQHAASLEQTVAARTAELQETVTHLESFSYTVAHDLRAPIRTLEHYATILLEDYGNNLDSQARTLLTNMGRAARRLDALTKDVLNYTKIASQRPELGPVDPAEVLHDITVMDPALQAPNVVIKVLRPISPVLASPTLLSQCFSNLLTNAVKFAKPGVVPQIEVSSETLSDGDEVQPVAGAAGAPTGNCPEPSPALARRRVRLWFKDNGVGIEPEAQNKVFGIFERGRGVSHIPGTGIGLAIVAKAVERMRGAYGVESSPGEGCRFWIELAAA